MDPTPAPSAPTGPSWGWLLVGVGVVGLAVRYFLWPLGGHGLMALTALFVSVVLAGLQVEKRRRSATPRPLGAATTGLTIAGAVAVSLGAAVLGFTRAAPPVTHELPGLQVTVPGWTVMERGAAFEQGRLKLADPDGEGRFLEVQWALSDPMAAEDVAALWGQMGMKVGSAAQATVSGHAATRFELAMSDGTKRSLATVWYCPEHERQLYVMSFLSRSPDELLAFHEEVAASVVCHRPLDGPIPKRVFPAFTPPPGFQEQTAPNARSYVSETETYGFCPGVPDPRLAETLASTPGLALTMATTMFEAPDLRLGPLEERQAADGTLRRAWRGEATLHGLPHRVVLMAWTRVEDGRTFVAFHAGPASATSDPVAVLLGAR